MTRRVIKSGTYVQLDEPIFLGQELSAEISRPTVIARRKGGRIDSIHVRCACGTSLEIMCEYEEPGSPQRPEEAAQVCRADPVTAGRDNSGG